jgi:hypothetical protein
MAVTIKLQAIVDAKTSFMITPRPYLRPAVLVVNRENSLNPAPTCESNERFDGSPRLTGVKIMKLFSVLTFGITAIHSLTAADTFRTDINPALLYHQGFSLRPDLSQQDHDYLFSNQWRGRVLDERFGSLIWKYDNSFKLFHRARYAQVPCDWGHDISDGPEALLPGLAKAKSAAQTARLRAMWHLQNGKPDYARDDLLAAFALGRNVSHDRVLISALVQYAIENIVASIVAENAYQLPPETLRQLADGFAAAPPLGLVADCIPVENISFSQYFVRKIEEARAQDEATAVGRVRQVLGNAFNSGEPPAVRGVRFEGSEGAAKADKIIAAAGGTIDGLLRLFREMPPLYEQVERILRLRVAEYEKRMAEFQDMVNKHPNPLVKAFFSLFDNCRKKEFATQITVAMARAGIEYKLRGQEGLQSVLDPCTGAPFDFERFIFEGVDRGFKLKSKYRGRDFDEVLIFVEKPGPLFRTTGKLAGEKVK